MSERVARGFVKVPILPIVYALSGPVIGAYRGSRGENSPLNYWRLIATYPTDGRVAVDWNDWKKTPGDDETSTLGVLLSMMLGTVTSSLPWLLTRGVRGTVEAGIALIKHGKLYESAKTFLYDLPIQSLRSIRRIL